MLHLNLKNSDLKSVCRTATFYTSLLFPAANFLEQPESQFYLYKLVCRCQLPVYFVYIAICLLEKLEALIDADNGCPQKLLIAALILAHKSHSDYVLYNFEWSKHSDKYTLTEVNQFEIEMFRLLDSNTTIDRQNFSKFLVYLQYIIPRSLNKQITYN